MSSAESKKELLYSSDDSFTVADPGFDSVALDEENQPPNHRSIPER